MSKKIKLLALSIFLFTVMVAGVFIWPGLSVKALSSNVLPDTLNGAVLIDVFEEEPSDGIVKGFTAYYESEDKDMSVLFWKVESEEVAQDGAELFIDGLKLEFDSMFDQVDWSPGNQFSVRGYQAKAASFRVYLGNEYYDGAVISVAVKEYFIVIQTINYESAPNFNDLTNALCHPS